MILNDNARKFEQPDAGLFLGTIIDVVDLGIVKSQFGEKAKLRVVWVLDKLDKEGKPFGVIGTYNAHMNERGNLYKTVAQVLNVPAPPVPFDSEILIGRSNQLFLVKSVAPDGKQYTNVGGILPLAAGQTGPKAPQGFVRAKDKQKQDANTQTRGVNSAINTAQAAPQAVEDDIAF